METTAEVAQMATFRLGGDWYGVDVLAAGSLVPFAAGARARCAQDGSGFAERARGHYDELIVKSPAWISTKKSILMNTLI